MDINVLNLGNKNNAISKLDVKPLKSNNKFNEVLSKTSKSNEDSQGVKTNVDSKKTKVELSPETKKALKDAGVSDKDIENIKSLKDMKNLIKEEVLNDKSDSGVDISKLMIVLAPFFNINIENLEGLKQNVIAGVKEDLNTAIKSVGIEEKLIPEKLISEKMTPEKTSQLLKCFGDELKGTLDKNFSKEQEPILNLILAKEVIPQIKEEIKTSKLPIASEDIMAKIEQELKLALSESLKGVKVDKTNKNSVSDLNAIQKEDLGSKRIFELAVTSKSENADKNYFSEEGETTKDDNFLKSLTNDEDKGDKISKVTNFMTQFNNVNKDAKVTEVEKMVINKATINNDIIKAVKYMEINSIKDLTVKVIPKELGEVIIKLTMEAGVMKATIATTNKEAFNLLNSNLLDMTNKLQNSDGKISNVSLNIYNEDTTFFRDGSNQENSGRDQKNKKHHGVGSIGKDTDVIDNNSIVDSNVNMLA